jgi:hypothetical protein
MTTTSNPYPLRFGHELRFGRKPAVFPVGLPAASSVSDFKPTVRVFDGVAGKGVKWQMLGNDVYGDCGPCGWVHGDMATALVVGDKVKYTTQQVEKAYLAFTNGQDDGVVLSELLGVGYKLGFCGQHAAGYLPLRGTMAELLGWVQQAKWVMGGFALQDAQEGQFNAGQPFTWIKGSPIAGGHCMDIVSFDQDRKLAKLLTWGKEHLCTFDFLENALEEKWGVAMARARARDDLPGDTGLWDTVQAVMQALHGHVLPG